MGSRIEVELTSVRPDGAWTWRAAGAREPKGVVPSSLLYEGVKVGDVVRAEAEFEVDGIELTSVLPPRERRRREPERLEVVGSGREPPLVTSTLVTGAARSRSRRPGRDRGRGEPEGGERPRSGTRARERAGRGGAGREREGTGEMSGRPPRADRAARPDGRARPDRPGRPQGGAKPERAARFHPPSVRRAALLESLSPEERPVAEQLLRGGLPAVRRALDEQNAASRAAGSAGVGGDELLAMAERLLPKVREAAWLDRAEAASKMLDQISLRDLRSVVVGSDVARDDSSRLLAGSLREALETKLAERRDEWAKGISSALDEGRVVRALNQSARPPDSGARLTAAMAARLRDAAGAALSPDVPPDRWLALLEAVASSPVRRLVKPSGLPAGAGPEVRAAAGRLAGQVPALAGLLGIKVPPPPGRLRRPRPSASAASEPGARPEVPASR